VDSVMLAPSCSLLHVPLDVEIETDLDEEQSCLARQRQPGSRRTSPGRKTSRYRAHANPMCGKSG
jgi:hypothetical protein